ncbi:MAG: glycosyltransferase family 2 protein [Magnetococcales bacterium]|nr:glycosyltransferase family 2 protein [Magnetococcales bacterium]
MSDLSGEAPTDLSLVIPVYNEEENVSMLAQEILDVARSLGKTFEIIFVDDGSSDQTVPNLQRLIPEVPELRVIRLARNYGQSTALQAGFDHAQGDIVITMDGDLQNDPQDIPLLLNHLKTEDVDVVSGWRKIRKDPPLGVFFSQVANRIISKKTGVHLNDYGCSLKVYRRDVLSRLRVYGELHRFLPALLSAVGAEIRELPVNHRPRVFGKSKYSLNKIFRVVLDLLLINFLRKYIQRPIQFFGRLGFYIGGSGFLISLYLAWVKFVQGHNIGERPLLLLGVTMMLTGVILVAHGLLGELIIRIMHEKDGISQYELKAKRGTRKTG